MRPTTKFVPVLLAVGILGAARAQSSGDDAAAEAYRRGDLAAARAQWTAALDDASLARPERARIAYDLGNVAYREKKLLEAIGWYTAALRLAPRDADAWANLEQARAEAHLEPADRGDLSATFARLASSFDPGESRWIALGGIALLAAGLGFEALRGGRAGRALAIAGCAAAAIGTVPWIVSSARERADAWIVIEEGKALVRSEPRADAAAIGELAAGSDVERTDELPRWVKLRTASGVEGWVPRESVFELRR